MNQGTQPDKDPTAWYEAFVEIPDIVTERWKRFLAELRSAGSDKNDGASIISHGSYHVEEALREWRDQKLCSNGTKKQRNKRMGTGRKNYGKMHLSSLRIVPWNQRPRI